MKIDDVRNLHTNTVHTHRQTHIQTPKERRWGTVLVTGHCTELQERTRREESEESYRRWIEDHLSSNNTRQVWQGVQHINYKSSNLSAAEGNTSLAKKINLLFVRFDVDSSSSPHPPVSSTHTLTVEEREVQVESGEPKERVPDQLAGALL